MNSRIVYPNAALHSERHLDILRQFVVYPEIKIIHIAAPISGRGNDSVCPPGIGIVLFLIIQEIRIKLPHNVVLVPEHQKPRRGRVLFSVRANPNSTQFQQEILIFQGFPDVPRTGQAHSLPVASDAFTVENGHIHFVQHQHILSLHGSIPHHSLVFFLGAAVISLAVPAIGA